MKKYAILFLLLMLMGIVTAQTPEWSWAQSAGGTTDDIGYSIAVDSNGNTYVTGFFKETASFDSITLTSSGNNDIFVAKLDSSGNWLWAKKAGGTNNDTGAGIALDSDGNIYLTGSFDSYPAYFGNIDLYCDLGEIFVAKLDSAGNWLWARSAGGVDSDRANCIAVDSAGGVYLSGYIGRSAHFGSILLTSHTVLDTDIFVAKLSSNGDWIWARGAGGPGSGDAGRGIAVDNLGNVYLTGDFIGIIADFGDTILTGAAQYKSDIFVAKLDSFGNWLWAKRAGGLEDDRSRAIAVDNAGNVYLTGGIWGTAEFGDTILIGAPFGFDIFVAKLDTEGEWIWAQKAGGPNNYSYDEQGYAIALDSNANVYVTGVFANGAAWGAVPTSHNDTWDQALCNWTANGYRLLTEAEWEYAARGATNNPDYLYSGSDDVDYVAWHSGNNNPVGTKPVGTKAANGLGLYDMSGNVMEWCWDSFNSAYYSFSPSDNPTGFVPCEVRAVRGGIWDNIASWCRVSCRMQGTMHNTLKNLGFRVCRTGL